MFNNKQARWGEVPKQEQNQEYSKLVHAVFKQNELGAKLLAYWTEEILQTVSVDPDPHKLAFTAGNEFRVKLIHDHIRRVEANQ
jgi:hypothetical protein